MTHAEAYERVRGAVEDAWTGGIDKVYWGNTEAVNPSAPYLVCSWRGLSGGQQTFGKEGGNKFRYNSMLIARVRVASHTGEVFGRQYADAILNALINGVDGVHFTRGHVRPDGSSGSYYQISVVVEMSYDDFR